jgi:hypothetical protein
MFNPSAAGMETRTGSGPEPHPFGQELAQVTEIAEEYGIRESKLEVDVVDPEESPEERELREKGLCKFGAEEYMLEIEGFYREMLGVPEPLRTMWI